VKIEQEIKTKIEHSFTLIDEEDFDDFNETDDIHIPTAIKVLAWVLDDTPDAVALTNYLSRNKEEKESEQ
jgi:hypothetical protein